MARMDTTYATYFLKLSKSLIYCHTRFSYSIDSTEATRSRTGDMDVTGDIKAYNGKFDLTRAV